MFNEIKNYEKRPCTISENGYTLFTYYDWLKYNENERYSFFIVDSLGRKKKELNNVSFSCLCFCCENFKG